MAETYAKHLMQVITKDRAPDREQKESTSLSYQKVTESLMASGYSKLGTQEVLNDMYVTQSNWDGTQTAPTLTANNAGGSQRMPDKENFNAIIGGVQTWKL